MSEGPKGPVPVPFRPSRAICYNCACSPSGSNSAGRVSASQAKRDPWRLLVAGRLTTIPMVLPCIPPLLRGSRAPLFVNTFNTHRGVWANGPPHLRPRKVRSSSRSPPCYNRTQVLFRAARPPDDAESGHRKRRFPNPSPLQGDYWQSTAHTINVQASSPSTEPRPRWPSRSVLIHVWPPTGRRSPAPARRSTCR